MQQEISKGGNILQLSVRSTKVTNTISNMLQSIYKIQIIITRNYNSISVYLSSYDSENLPLSTRKKYIDQPIVGIVVTISPSFSLYKMVVFPAASRPTKKDNKLLKHLGQQMNLSTTLT